MDRKNGNKTLAQKMGYAFGVILMVCLTTVIVASTIKFLFWMF